MGASQVMSRDEARELREMATTAREASLVGLRIARDANWKAKWARIYSIGALLVAIASAVLAFIALQD